ncbi:MAG: hypothetical protein DLM68_10390 [Hyphomicrobiales bacterium]|nr:MAG: hypothetical protein DLM68_10390 [Hyphomicrobiales bacterium]
MLGEIRPQFIRGRAQIAFAVGMVVGETGLQHRASPRQISAGDDASASSVRSWSKVMQIGWAVRSIGRLSARLHNPTRKELI